jgi:hypothetical protein
MLHVFNQVFDGRLAGIDLTPEVRRTLDEQRVKLAGIMPPANLSAETRSAVEQAIADSFVSAFRVVMLMSAGLALLSGLSAWVMIEGKIPHDRAKAPG